MNKIIILLLITITFSINANSQTAFEQLQKVLAGDAEANDLFGWSVSISGKYAVVGAIGENTGGNASGAAYFFELNSGTWTEMNKVTASDAQTGDEFGISVSISGNYAAIGAHREDEVANNAGAVYFFELDGGTWTQMNKVTASDAQEEDRFGISVSISGNNAVVGAHNESAGGTNAGAAYFFELDGGTWTETNKVTASDAQASDNFGWSVSISGNNAVVGAYNEDEGGNNAGAAYFFELDGGTWTETNKVTASDAQASDYFGYSVSISDNYAVVGAAWEKEGGNSAGAVYFFELNGGSWTETNKVTASDIQAYDLFGWSVSISGNKAVVGAIYEDEGGNSAGAAYFFELNSGTWTETNKVIASVPNLSFEFGYSVSVSGNYAMVGEIYENTGGSNAGAAYIFLNLPKNHSSTFTLASNEVTQLVFNIESSEDILADGYIILYKQGSSFTGVPVNGGNYSVGTTIGDATVGAIITDADAVEATVANLTKQTEYHFKIYPFNWDGSDITSAVYKTDGTVPSLTVVTVPTLGEWGMIAFVGFMAIGGFVYMRRRIA